MQSAKSTVICLLVVLLPLVAFSRFAFAEVPEWKNAHTQFRANGTCTQVNRGRSARNQYNSPDSQHSHCGDALYAKMKQCLLVDFYRDEPVQQSAVMTNPEMEDAVLLVLDGCVQCPFGAAEATIQLVNNLPAGPLFSGCWEQRVLVSSVTVQLEAESARGTTSHGTFSLGGTLRERDHCSTLFGSGKQLKFDELVLEVRHNCGQKRQMVLKVPVPHVDTRALVPNGKFAQLTGISLNLGIYGTGWDERWVRWEAVRTPKQRQQQQQRAFEERKGATAQKEHNPFDRKMPMVTSSALLEHGTDERVVASTDTSAEQSKAAAPSTDAESPKNDGTAASDRSHFWHLIFGAIGVLLLCICLVMACPRLLDRNTGKTMHTVFEKP